MLANIWNSARALRRQLEPLVRQRPLLRATGHASMPRAPERGAVPVTSCRVALVGLRTKAQVHAAVEELEDPGIVIANAKRRPRRRRDCGGIGRARLLGGRRNGVPPNPLEPALHVLVFTAGQGGQR